MSSPLCFSPSLRLTYLSLYAEIQDPFLQSQLQTLVLCETEAGDSLGSGRNLPSSLPLLSCFLNQGLRVSHRVKRCVEVQLSHGSPGTSPGMAVNHHWEGSHPSPRQQPGWAPTAHLKREGQCEFITASDGEQVGQGTPPVPISSLIPFIIILY